MSDLIDDSIIPATREILSVSELNRKARQLLETHLPLLWVEGEISNFAKPSSGHWYFTLKDANAQVRCAMFRNRNNEVRFKPEQGIQVLVRARVSLYEGRGDYQLIVEHMEEAGFGVLQRAFEALKAKLLKEGLLDELHKQDIPELPKHIAVITSPTGAAIRDVLTVLRRRFPSIPLTILPVPVQGEGAAQKIVEAIERANSVAGFDVILLTRGGGSLEDLWPFNEEIVARAIFASELPVVSAVGHEVDVTISDFVADARAPTPSAAAELLSPDRDDWEQTFAGYEMLLAQAMQRLIKNGRAVIESFRARLRHPGQRIQSANQHLDHLEMRLRHAIEHHLHRQHSRLQGLMARHRPYHPAAKIAAYGTQVQQLLRRLRNAMKQSLQMQQQHFRQLAGLLDSMSPLNTLKRGYSLTLNRNNHIVRDVGKVNVGDRITTKLAHGELLSKVEAINADYDRVDKSFTDKN